jgi:hypothetical protein
MSDSVVGLPWEELWQDRMWIQCRLTEGKLDYRRKRRKKGEFWRELDLKYIVA